MFSKAFAVERIFVTRMKLMMMHFSFVHNMFYNYLCCYFSLWLRYDINNAHMKIYQENKKRRKRKIFVDAIIWFISAHVCSSFWCASLCLSLRSRPKWYNKQFETYPHIRHNKLEMHNLSLSLVQRYRQCDNFFLLLFVIKITTLKSLEHVFLATRIFLFINTNLIMFINSFFV